MSITPLLVRGEHILPMKRMAPVVCSLIKIIKGCEALNTGGKLTVENVTPVTAAPSVPVTSVNEIIL